MGQKLNLVIDQGSTFQKSIIVKHANGDIVDLTGYNGSGQIRKHYTSLTSTNLQVSLGGNTGNLTISLTANSTSNLSSGRYVYDVELTDLNNEVSRALEGIVTITPQVTK